VKAQKPRTSGASGDQLAGGVDSKARAERNDAHPAQDSSLLARRVTGRSGRTRFVALYVCGCGLWHQAVAPLAASEPLLRKAPCGRRIWLDTTGLSRGAP
jgi:hypothetical protein